MAFHYLSFAGEEGWRGCTVVEADSFLAALLKTHHLGINPGGEVASIELCEETMDNPDAAARVAACLNRLMTREQIAEAFGEDDLIPMNLEG
jgi:hypothetical protein